ncbi:hypothetical protein BDV59DRAFT_152674 [Aspergillus ambiguus]|uniref:Zn(II)2Cys6 transcription factor domain-containing protein n=1 Tax=Aspergillus ambiguus TaxID=176160 RepID=UPI003CCDF8F1
MQYRQKAMENLTEFTSLTGKPQRPCWECRRRRLVCDISIPECNKCRASGVDCPGYGKHKPLRWLTPGKVRSRTNQRKRTDSGQKDVSSLKHELKTGSPSCSGDDEVSTEQIILRRDVKFCLSWEPLPAYKLNTEACAIMQAVSYCKLTFLEPELGFNIQLDNHCIYLEYAPLHRLAPCPYASLFPLSGLHLCPLSICHTLVYLALSHYIHNYLSDAGHSAVAEARFRVYHHRGIAIASLTNGIGKITDRANDSIIVSVLMVLFADVSHSSLSFFLCLNGSACTTQNKLTLYCTMSRPGNSPP